MRRAAIGVLLALGCRPAPEVQPPVAEKGGHEAKAPDKHEAHPSTAEPQPGPPKIVEASYDPAADPRNAGGWKLDATVAVDDPAQARKAPFSIEALYRIVALGSPTFSPDGTQILFTRTQYDLAKGESNADVWRVGADGQGMTRMTNAPGRDADPRWAPDGKSFVFVSTRGGSSQLWRMPIDGGEPEQLTDLSTEASDPQVSPDGTKIAFVSSVFPEYGADDAGNKAQIEDLEKSPTKAHVADELLYRHWTAWGDGRRSHVLVLDLGSKEIVDVTPGDFDSPAFGDETVAWAPDSSELCFVSNRDKGSAQAWTTNKDLYVVPAGGGKVVDLTASNPAYDGSPIYSPDGRWIAFRRQTRPGSESDRFRLALYDRKSGETRVLTESFDNWVQDVHWAPDSSSLFFSAPDQGRTPLFSVPVAGGDISRLAIPSVRGYTVSPKGQLAFTFSRVNVPVELFTADARGQGVQRITGFNDDVAETYDLRPVEELWIEGAEGKKVHVFVVKPHGFRNGKRYPLIVNVHGGPQYQWQDYLRGDWQVYPGAGYGVAFFNPHGSTGYGQAYTDSISGDWGGRVYEDVMAVTDALAREPWVDSHKIGAMGWSYGGYMMNWLLGHTDRFAAIASMMGIYDLTSFYGATEELWFPEWDLRGTPWDDPEEYRKWSPSTYASSFATPTLVVTGERDYRVPYTQSLQLFTALRRQDVPARLVVFPNDGHWPSFVKSMPLYYAAHLDWFSRWLGGEPAPQDLLQIVRGRAQWREGDEPKARAKKGRGKGRPRPHR